MSLDQEKKSAIGYSIRNVTRARGIWARTRARIGRATCSRVFTMRRRERAVNSRARLRRAASNQPCVIFRLSYLLFILFYFAAKRILGRSRPIAKRGSRRRPHARRRKCDEAFNRATRRRRARIEISPKNEPRNSTESRCERIYYTLRGLLYFCRKYIKMCNYVFFF